VGRREKGSGVLPTPLYLPATPSSFDTSRGFRLSKRANGDILALFETISKSLRDRDLGFGSKSAARAYRREFLSHFFEKDCAEIEGWRQFIHVQTGLAPSRSWTMQTPTPTGLLLGLVGIQGIHVTFVSTAFLEFVARQATSQAVKGILSDPGFQGLPGLGRSRSLGDRLDGQSNPGPVRKRQGPVRLENAIGERRLDMSRHRNSPPRKSDRGHRVSIILPEFNRGRRAKTAPDCCGINRCSAIPSRRCATGARS
jgi:hypothetical protein